MSIRESCLFLREDSVDAETKAKGVMIAFYPPREVAEKYAQSGGESAEELHMTLAYLGKTDTIPSMDDVDRAMKTFAGSHGPVDGLISGLGRFNASETSNAKDVIYASLDLPRLPDFRQSLVSVVEDMSEARASRMHGFTPHMTLTYIGVDEDSPVRRIESTPVRFESVFLVIGEEKREYKLEGRN